MTPCQQDDSSKILVEVEDFSQVPDQSSIHQLPLATVLVESGGRSGSVFQLHLFSHPRLKPPSFQNSHQYRVQLDLFPQRVRVRQEGAVLHLSPLPPDNSAAPQDSDSLPSKTNVAGK